MRTGDGHNSQMNVVRPSIAATSKSNNSSMCIHGAIEQERLEKRYDTKLAEHEENEGEEIKALQIDLEGNSALK